MKKWFLFILSAMLIMASLTACGTQETSGTDADVIKIGVFEPMTGANAAGGEMTVEATNVASKLVDKDKVVVII